MTANNLHHALVIDANVAVAVCARETNRETLANTELKRHAELGYKLYAPGVIVGEALYALCRKSQAVR